MALFFVTCVVSFFVVVTSLTTEVPTSELPTIDEIDLTYYIGRWYQIYASRRVYATFEANATCCTATYTIYNPVTLTVYNTQNLYTIGGEFDDIRGWAYASNTTGALDVDFPSVPEGPRGDEPNYWIMKLGPVLNNLYEYSLVSEPTRTYLFVLCRDIERYFELYDAEVLQFLYDNGFNQPRNEPIITAHNSSCIYPIEPEIPAAIVY